MDYSDRVAYRCIVACVGETQGDLDITIFFIFLLLCSCDEANLLPKERDSLCLWIAICVFNILCRRITWIGIKNQICPNPPHVWVELDIAGKLLDIIRINKNNPENKLFYSLRVISAYYLSHFIMLFFGLIDFMPWGGFGLVIWEDMDTVQILPKCLIPP